MSDKRYVMEIADLVQDRRETTFSYGRHRITIAYNPAEFTYRDFRQERESTDELRFEALADTLEGRKVQRYLGDGFVEDPDGLALHLFEAMNDALADTAEQRMIQQLSGGLLLEWPVVEQGEPVPINEETVSSQPFLFITDLYKAIFADMRPGKNSSAGRAPAPPRRKSRR